MDETGFFGVADRLLKVRIRKADVTADGLSARHQECGALALRWWSWAMKRCALKTVSGDHLPMVPQ